MTFSSRKRLKPMLFLLVTTAFLLAVSAPTNRPVQLHSSPQPYGTPTLCDLGPFLLESEVEPPDPHDFGGSLYLSDILDPSTPRNQDLQMKYYSLSKLRQFKDLLWYKEHTGHQTSQLNLSEGTYFTRPNNTFVEYFTGGVDLIRAHSHNDYERQTPLFDALQRGFNSIEADVWYTPENCGYNDALLYQMALDGSVNLSDTRVSGNELYVAHKKGSISKKRTLQSMYLTPLMYMLNQINEFYSIPKETPLEQKAGLFFNYPNETLNILVDFKENGFLTFALLMKWITPFIARNYVSYYDFELQRHVRGPLTFILSGLAPTDLIGQMDLYCEQARSSRRYVYIDGDLTSMTGPYDYSKLNYYVSKKFSDVTKSRIQVDSLDDLKEDVKRELTPIMEQAHKLGLKTRLWGEGGSKDDKRKINAALIQEVGLDVLNMDDLDLGVEIYKSALSDNWT